MNKDTEIRNLKRQLAEVNQELTEALHMWVQTEQEVKALLTQRDLREARGVESSYSDSYRFDDE